MARHGFGYRHTIRKGKSGPFDATLPTPTADYVSRTSYPPTLQNLAYVGEDRGIIRFRIEVYSLPNLTTPTITGTIGIGATGLTTLTGTPIVSPTVSVARIRVETATSYGPWSAYLMHGDIAAPTFSTTSPLAGTEYIPNQTFNISVSSYTTIQLQGGADIGNYSLGPTVSGVAVLTRTGRPVTGAESVNVRGVKLNDAYADLALTINYADVSSTGLATDVTPYSGLAQGATVTRTHVVALPAGVSAPLLIAGFGSYTINGGASLTSASPVQYVSNTDVIVFSITAATAWSTNRTQDVSLAGQTITWGAGTMANPAGVQIIQSSNTPLVSLDSPGASNPATHTFSAINFLAGVQMVAIMEDQFRALQSPEVSIGGIAANRVAGIVSGTDVWSVWWVIGTAGAKNIVINYNTGFGSSCFIQCCTIQNYATVGGLGVTPIMTVATRLPSYNPPFATSSSLTIPTDGQAVIFASRGDGNAITSLSTGMTQQSRECVYTGAAYKRFSMFTTASSGAPEIGLTSNDYVAIAAIAFTPA